MILSWFVLVVCCLLLWFSLSSVLLIWWWICCWNVLKVGVRNCVRWCCSWNCGCVFLVYCIVEIGDDDSELIYFCCVG